VESGDGGHLAGVGRRGAHRQDGAYAVAGHGDRPGADLGLGGEEPEVGVGVAQGTFGGVRLISGISRAKTAGRISSPMCSGSSVTGAGPCR
jgi:hypothetical protein